MYGWLCCLRFVVLPVVARCVSFVISLVFVIDFVLLFVLLRSLCVCVLCFV